MQLSGQHRLHQANSMGKECGHIEELLAMLVRECKGEKYLSSSIDDSSIDEIDDIIIDDPSSTDASGIIGSVEHLQNTRYGSEQQQQCLQCSSKVVCQDSDTELLQNVASCKDHDQNSRMYASHFACIR